MNQLNSRVITDEFNILKNITLNYYFVVLLFSEAILQVLLIQFGSVAFSVAMYGLTGRQWGICVGFSAISFVVGVLLKTIPLENFIQTIVDKFQACKRMKKIQPTNDPNDAKQKMLKDSSKLPSLVKSLRKQTLMDQKNSSKIRTPKLD